MLAKLFLLAIAAYAVIAQPLSSDVTDAPLANDPVQTNAAKDTNNMIHVEKDEKEDATDLLNSAKTSLLGTFLMPFVTANDYAQEVIKDFLQPQKIFKKD